MKPICRTYLIVLLILVSQSFRAQTVIISNSSNKTLKNCTVEIPLNKIKWTLGSYIAIGPNKKVVPIELIRDLDATDKAVFPLAQIGAKTTISFKIRQGVADMYPKRTYADLSYKISTHRYIPVIRKKYVNETLDKDFFWSKANQMKLPGDFKNHSYYVKDEGPGWENDKICFRLYLDDRNKIDVYGKKTSALVLPEIGVNNYESYHKMALWGMDNLRVGQTLGIGSIASWDGKKACAVDTRDSTFCAIVTDGKIASQIKTIYYGWKNEQGKSMLTSLITIEAGSRTSKIELKLDNPIIQLATGIIDNPDAEYFVPENTHGKWTYIATFGRQSMNDDNQGLAVFARKNQIEKITRDSLNYVIVFKKQSKEIEYYIMPTWELGVEPIVTKQDFINCINKELDKLDNPLKIRITK